MPADRLAMSAGPGEVPASGHTDPPCVVEMLSITKTFLDVTANRDVNFSLREGKSALFSARTAQGRPRS